ncbi:MAG TPA: hypothetical protein VKK79_22020, partial [Candidatus Lokiarchaeia archaeon]|nr:hypothetical protein [Candidatus Lokiarchaeia archaeon]
MSSTIEPPYLKKITHRKETEAETGRWLFFGGDPGCVGIAGEWMVEPKKRLQYYYITTLDLAGGAVVARNKIRVDDYIIDFVNKDWFYRSLVPCGFPRELTIVGYRASKIFLASFSMATNTNPILRGPPTALLEKVINV